MGGSKWDSTAVLCAKLVVHLIPSPPLGSCQNPPNADHANLGKNVSNAPNLLMVFAIYNYQYRIICQSDHVLDHGSNWLN